MNNAAKNFDILAISLQTKILSDLYLAKFLDIIAKPFFQFFPSV